MILLDLLPEVIFRLIKTFLSSDDYHYFLNSSKERFGELKKKSIFFSLNRRWSSQYINNLDFQRVLLNKVDNGWNQIGVELSDNSTSIEIPSDLPIHKIVAVSGILPVTLWNNYHSIVCPYESEASEIPPIPNVREMKLFLARGSVDFNSFRHLKKLELSKKDSFTLPPDIASLRNIPDLTIEKFSNIEDFSMFSNQKILKILFCNLLTNVDSFRYIHKLELYCCKNITDIHLLHGIYDLSIMYCEGIKDISGLGNHHRLKLGGWSSNTITNFNCLISIPHVSLDNCFIKDISVCKCAKSVYLNNCSNIFDVGSLKNLEKVEIITSIIDNKLIGLHELGNIKDLSLYLNHHQVINDDLLSQFNNHRLKLSSRNMKITSLSVFSRSVKHLTIVNGNTFARRINEGQGSLLQHLTSLTLDSVAMGRLEGLGSIPNLTLLGCDYIKSLDGLGRNRSVVVKGCRYLEDVSSLATVPIVTIRFCKKLSEQSFECLKQVPRLKIVQ